MKGEMGKLHMIGTWIMRTLQQQDQFSQKVLQASGKSSKGPLLPLMRNITHWCNDAKSSDRAFDLRDVLRELIGIAIKEQRQIKSRRDIPHSGHLPTRRPMDNQFLEQISHNDLALHDWVDLTTILYTLRRFPTLTLEVQGLCSKKHDSHRHLARVLPEMDQLLAHLESVKMTYSDTSIYSIYVLTSINYRWSV